MHSFDYHHFDNKFVLNHKRESRELKTDNTISKISIKKNFSHGIKILLYWKSFINLIG